jgi:hypothetical protein
MKDPTIDPKRAIEFADANTGIHLRAKDQDGKWLAADIATLDKESLIAWLRSRGGDNQWAEDVVGILLGHGHLHEADES